MYTANCVRFHTFGVCRFWRNPI